MGVIEAYGLRLERKRWRMRARRRRRDLMRAVDRTKSIRPDDILVFSTVRNEMIRLPYFLRYYRNLGVRHFLIVDNGSTDGTADYLAEQGDVSLFHTNASYRRARFGSDWMNWLLHAYGHGHWCLTVDPDEFLIYPFCDTRPLPALTDWLQASAIRSFGTLLLDLYPKGPIDEVPYHAGQDPLEIAHWFDSGNYTIERNWRHRNLWIQGGPRARMFFGEDPGQAPALNKVPLVKWDRRFAYVSGTHMLLPRGLNLTYDEWGGEKASGVLLHAKFLSVFEEKAREETTRREHYAEGREYRAYQARAKTRPILWNRWSERYVNWRQLDALGLMSKGNWA